MYAIQHYSHQKNNLADAIYKLSTATLSVLFCVLQMYRSRVRCLLGLSVQRAEELQCEDFRQGSSLQLSTTNKWFSRWEESTLLTYAWAWKTHSLSIKRPGRVLTLWLRWTRGQWFCFLFCVKQIRAIGPPVMWELFLRSVVCCENEKDSHYWQPTQVQLWPKMAQKLNPRGGWKEWSRHNNTQKNLMEHFWFNFNTRLIVFSWTHCCQDVNCFGIFFFLFKT